MKIESQNLARVIRRAQAKHQITKEAQLYD